MYYIIKTPTYSTSEQESKPGYWVIEADGLREAKDAWVEEYNNSLERTMFMPITDFADAEEGESDRGFIGYSKTSSPT